MKHVSRAGKLSLPLANEPSKLSDLSGKCDAGTDTRFTPKHLGPRYACGAGHAITLLANLRLSA
jgi:hypothetical protein